MNDRVRSWIGEFSLPLLWVAMCSILLASPAFAASPADARIGVVLFETAGPPDAELPDVATLLADRIGTLGAGTMVGPAAMGAVANASPTEATVRGLAATSGVDVIVVGRSTQIGGLVSVDVRLRSGKSGKPLATYVAEVGPSNPLPSVVQTLATQVLGGSVDYWASNLQPSEVSAPEPAPVQSPARAFDNNKPISIKSKTLEASDVEGRRRLVFTGDVRVSQDDVEMSSNSLTAEYPAGSSQPSQMVARGAVRVTQNGQEVRCDTGTYKRREAKLLCCGNAELRDGGSRVRGSCIEFDLKEDKVRVEDATIHIAPEESNGSGTGGS